MVYKSKHLPTMLNGFNTVELKYFGTGKKSYLSSEPDREEERVRERR